MAFLHPGYQYAFGIGDHDIIVQSAGEITHGSVRHEQKFRLNNAEIQQLRGRS